MTGEPNDSLNCDLEWPGAPRPDSLRQLSAQAVVARTRAYWDVLTGDHLRKIASHAKLRDLRQVWRMVSDLANSRLEPEFKVAPLRPSQPLVSVVIPCFNYGRFVEQAIDSILGQTLKNVEIIVVDGGSTDETTRELLARLQLPRTVVHLREGRHYAGSNRNFGIERASGRYICCLDADDTLQPTYLEKAVFLLETYGYDCVSTSLRFMGAREGTVGIRELPDLAAMLRGNYMLTCAVFRRCLWVRSQGFIDTGIGAVHVYEDWDFWIQLAAHGARMRNLVDEPLFNYRIHSDGSSLSSSVGMRPIAEHRKAIQQRHAAMLGREQLAVSRAQRKRCLRCDTPGGVLSDSFARSATAGPTLLIALPFLLVGGAERLLSSVTGYLVRRGWRVVLVTTKHCNTIVSGDSSGWFFKHTSEIYQLPKFLKPVEWHAFLLYILNSRRPDCLLLAGSRFIYEHLPELRQKYPAMAIVDLLFNTSGHVRSHQAYRACFTSVLAENTEVVEWFCSIGWPASRVHQVKNGTDTDNYRPRSKPSDLMSKLGIEENELVVGFLGRMSKEKAPELFLDIARACAARGDIRFLMAGVGPLAKRISKMASNLPRDVRLTYLGKADDVQACLGLYDLLVVPSRLDGRPMVVIEALSMGIPVIASRVGGLPELVTEGETGHLCAPSDVGAFAARILEIAADRGRLARMKVAAREFALQHLTAEQMFGAYERALVDAIEVQRKALTNTASRPTERCRC